MGSSPILGTIKDHIGDRYMVSGSAWCGRRTVNAKKGNSESGEFESRWDRYIFIY